MAQQIDEENKNSFTGHLTESIDIKRMDISNERVVRQYGHILISCMVTKNGF